MHFVLAASAGAKIGPAEIGLLATVGATSVAVHRKPVVAVLSTGDELVEPDQPLGDGQIRDSNRSSLIAALRKALDGNITIIDLGIANDTPEAIAAKMHRGLQEADVLITSGGVSMGEVDLVKAYLEQNGNIHVGRVSMKPGKPLMFATIDVEGVPKKVFATPGSVVHRT
jgi:gephyrin